MARRIVDLSFPIHEGMTTFPVHWHPRVQVTTMGTHAREKRETRKLVLGTHTGTHCDAPRHFIPKGKTIDQLSLEPYIGEAVVLDLSKLRPKTKVEVQTLRDILGNTRPRRIVLRFDWSRHWKSKIYYTDHPFLSEAACRWLVKRGLKLLAMDTPMPDDPLNGRGTRNDSPNHKILLGNGVLLVEYLCNLRAVKKKKITLVALPLNIRDGDGAPARCVAIES